MRPSGTSSVGRPVWRWRRRLPGAAALGVLAFLSSCGSSDMFEPIGIGSERDDLKRSPCACIELPQDYSAWRRG